MKKIMRNQKGQGIMEYVIISSLIGIFCLVAVREFGTEINKRIDYMKTQVTKGIDTRKGIR
jgi:Flp pilus assembly pilin Flp